VNGRELTAEGVKYTYDRFLGTRANRNRGVLEPVERVDVLDPQTVRFSLLEPYAWFLDALASTSTWIGRVIERPQSPTAFPPVRL
jgi:ABC-type transport system substrate-binding protein